MTWFICAISGSSPQNWDLCKATGLYGVATSSSKLQYEVNVGDDLVFWLTKKGYVGHATVTGKPRPPKSSAEAPWPGGLYRFSIVVPFKLDLECEDPVFMSFERSRQKNTGIASFSLQRGFALISDNAGETALKAMQNAEKETKRQKSSKTKEK